MSLPGLLSPAQANADGKDETERWVPSLAITSGLMVQGGTAWTSSSNVLAYNYTDCAPCPRLVNDPFRPPTAGSSSLLAPTVGGDLEIMTPGLTQLIGRPRLFAHAGFDYAFGFDYDVSKEGVPENMVIPPHTGAYTLVAVKGQGTRLTAGIDSVVVRAGLGVAFTGELLGRRVRIKPSIEWMSSSVELEGVTNAAFEATAPGWIGSARFYTVGINATTNKRFNSIGPGLEFEIDTVRAGPIVIALGISGGAYHVLGDRNVQFSGRKKIRTGKRPRLEPFSPLLPANTLPVPVPLPVWGGFTEASPAGPFDETVVGNFQYEQDAWGYRGGIAIRFRFAPE